MNIDKNILHAAIMNWGEDAQIQMAIEEFTEASLSLQKLRRIPKNNKDKIEKIESVYDEIADARIMIEQMIEIFGEKNIQSRIDYKMNRLKDRLKFNYI